MVLQVGRAWAMVEQVVDVAVNVFELRGADVYLERLSVGGSLGGGHER